MKSYYLNFNLGTIRVCEYNDIDRQNLLDSLPILFSFSDKPCSDHQILTLELYCATVHIEEGDGERILIHGGKNPEYAVTRQAEDTVYYSFPDGTFVLIDKDSTVAKCFTNGRTSKYLRFFIKQFVFEYLYSIGYFTIHAAAFSYKDKTYLICGEKGQGKTTLLLSLYAANNDVSIISNDRVLVRKESSGYSVISADTAIRATEDSVNLVEARFNTNLQPYFSSLQGKDKLYSSLRKFNRKIDFSTKLSGFIRCQSGFSDEITVSIFPEDSIIQDKEEHPDWLNITNNSNYINNTLYSTEDCFDFLSYSREEDIVSSCKRILNIINKIN